MRATWIVTATMLLVGACTPTLVVQKTITTGPESPPAAPAAPAPIAAPSSDDGPSLTVTYPLAPEIARVQILVEKHPPRPAEVLGVFDFHTRADSEDKGFDQLRLAASRLGADAVIGAEFEHGDGAEPSHLSGMAVRFLDH